MVALALDIGETRIGIAVSSRDGKMAMPVKVLPAAEVTGMAKTFRYLVEDYEPDILVSGRPLTMAGEPGPQAERVAAVAQKIADELELPLEFEDERLSSQEAKRILREQGLNEKQMRGKIDMIAASLFLQTWLDRKNEEVSHNAKVFQTNIPHSYLYAEAADRFIRYLGNRKVVFLSHTPEEPDKRDFIGGLKEELNRAHIAYHEIKFGNELNLLDQDSILADASGIVFVPTSAKKKVLSLIVAPIESLKEKRADLDIALFGYPEWLTQVPEYLNEFYKLNTYLYSRFYANPFEEDTKTFHKRFLYWYNKDMINASPQYALLGFDTGIYFLSAIREHGKNFASQDIRPSIDRIQTDFSFQRVNNWSGFINKSFYFINFTPNFTIRKIRE